MINVLELERRINPAVEKDRITDLIDSRQAPQPLAVLSLRTKCFSMLHEAEGMSFHPRFLDGHPTLAGLDPRIVTKGIPAALLRTAVRESRIVFGDDVAHVAEEVHHFMVAQAYTYGSALFLCVSLKRHDVIQDRPALRAAIHKVAKLNECGLAACPLVSVVDKSGDLEDHTKSVKVTVDVTHGHDAFRLGSLDRCRQKKEQASDPKEPAQHGERLCQAYDKIQQILKDHPCSQACPRIFWIPKVFGRNLSRSSNKLNAERGFPMRKLRIALYPAVSLLLAVAVFGQVRSQVIQGEELENFLLKAEFTEMKGISVGITAPKKVTLVLNGETKYGVFKTVDEYKNLMKFDDGRVDMNFQDSWKSEIAAYEIDKIIGLGMVPATVERTYKGAKGSLQFWVDSMMSEADHLKRKVQSPNPDQFNELMYKTRLFDNMVYNTDRNLQNLLITKDWELILIDHSRAFRPQTMLKSPKDLEKFSRSMLEGIAKLTRENLTAKAGKYLPKPQIDGVLKRRDQILELAKKSAEQKGELAYYK